MALNERSGWVKLMRETVQNPLLNKDPEYLALWVHLLCSAAYEPTSALLGGEMVVLQPGQFTTGRKRLSLNSGISESKVERILKAFENAQLIEQRKSNKNRLISICLWDMMQGGEQQNEQQMDNHRTTAEQPPNTFEEIKNLRIKEDMADKPPRAARFTPPSVDEVRAYCSERKNSVDPERFVDFYAANGWKQGRGKPIVDWKAAVRTWERKEDVKQTPAPVEDWTIAHPEWADQSTWVPGPDGIYRPAEVLP